MERLRTVNDAEKAECVFSALKKANQITKGTAGLMIYGADGAVGRIEIQLACARSGVLFEHVQRHGSAVPFTCKLDMEYLQAVLTCCETGSYDVNPLEKTPSPESITKIVVQTIFHANLCLIFEQWRVQLGPEVAFTKFSGTIQRLMKGKSGAINGKDLMAVVNFVYSLPEISNCTQSLRGALITLCCSSLETINDNLQLLNAVCQHDEFVAELRDALMANHSQAHSFLSFTDSKDPVNAAGPDNESLQLAAITAENTTPPYTRIQESIAQAQFFLANINKYSSHASQAHGLSSFEQSLRRLITAEQYAAVATRVYGMDGQGADRLRETLVDLCIELVVNNSEKRAQIENAATPEQFRQDCRQRAQNLQAAGQISSQSASIQMLDATPAPSVGAQQAVSSPQSNSLVPTAPLPKSLTPRLTLPLKSRSKYFQVNNQLKFEWPSRAWATSRQDTNATGSEAGSGSVPKARGKKTTHTFHMADKSLKGGMDGK